MNLAVARKACLAAAYVVIAVGAFNGASAAPVNLLANPGFETGDFTGWTIGGNSLQSGVSLDGTLLSLAEQPFSGNAANVRTGQYVAHGLIRSNIHYASPFTEVVTLAQSIAVTPNQTASIGFYLGGEMSERYGSEIGNGCLQIFVDGVGLLSDGHMNIAYGASPGDFTLFDAQFDTGLRSQVEVAFTISGSGTSRVNASFDDFFVYAVPEPASMQLLATLGAGAFALGRWRR